MVAALCGRYLYIPLGLFLMVTKQLLLLQPSFFFFFNPKPGNGRKGHVNCIFNFSPIKLKLAQILEILTAELSYVSTTKIVFHGIPHVLRRLGSLEIELL